MQLGISHNLPLGKDQAKNRRNRHLTFFFKKKKKCFSMDKNENSQQSKEAKWILNITYNGLNGPVSITSIYAFPSKCSFGTT
jgi:hypothetical protein